MLNNYSKGNLLQQPNFMQTYHFPLNNLKNSPGKSTFPNKCFTEEDHFCDKQQPLFDITQFFRQSRQNKENSISKKFDDSSKKLQTQNSQCIPTREKQSDQEMAHYLLNQILLIISNMNKFNRNKITFLDYLEILRELNMIPSSYEPTKNDCVFVFWGLLTQNNRDWVCLINLSMLLLAVMNLKGSSQALKRFFQQVQQLNETKQNFHIRKKITPDVKVLKKSKEGYFELSKNDIAHIYKQFNQFRVNRIYLGQIEKKNELWKSKSLLKYPFQPTISEKSKSLAKIRRQKNIFFTTKQSEVLSNREKQDLQECTFQPNSHRTQQVDIKNGVLRSQILYNKTTQKSKDKKDLSKDEIQLVKNRDNYTFHPEIHNFQRSNSKKKVNGQDKQMERFHRARMEQELKKKALNKGITLSEKQIRKITEKIKEQIKLKPNKQKQKAKSKQKSKSRKSLRIIIEDAIQPQVKQLIVNVEIYINDTQKHFISVYQGDKPQEIAKNFCICHKLDIKLENQLIKEIQAAIKASKCDIIKEENSDEEHEY